MACRLGSSLEVVHVDVLVGQVGHRVGHVAVQAVGARLTSTMVQYLLCRVDHVLGVLVAQVGVVQVFVPNCRLILVLNLRQVLLL